MSLSAKRNAQPFLDTRSRVLDTRNRVLDTYHRAWDTRDVLSDLRRRAARQVPCDLATLRRAQVKI